MEPTLSPQEDARLSALREYHVLDSAPERSYDDITALAAQICSVPIAMISLVDNCRQWFKSKVGIVQQETNREVAFCAHAILEAEPLVVPDARQDRRFADSILVTGEPYIRFYAGFPLRTSEGLALGTLCVIDRQPRQLLPEQRRALHALARQVMQLLELRRVSAHLAVALERVKTLHGLLPICGWCKRIRDDQGYWEQVDRYVASHTEVGFSHGICPDCLEKVTPHVLGEGSPAQSSSRRVDFRSQ